MGQLIWFLLDVNFTYQVMTRAKHKGKYINFLWSSSEVLHVFCLDLNHKQNQMKWPVIIYIPSNFKLLLEHPQLKKYKVVQYVTIMQVYIWVDSSISLITRPKKKRQASKKKNQASSSQQLLEFANDPPEIFWVFRAQFGVSYHTFAIVLDLDWIQVKL